MTGERTTTRAGAARLRDVAQAAGVSVKTVSNGVNGTARVADETRLRVQHAIDSLGYHPNLMALGAMRAIHEAGLRVPQDVALVGFDDVEESCARAVAAVDGSRGRESRSATKNTSQDCEIAPLRP